MIAGKSSRRKRNQFIKKYTPLSLYTKTNEYFEDEGNRPYSRYDLCGFLGITMDEFTAYAKSKTAGYADIIRLADTKIIASIEKGDMSPSLATFLLKSMTAYSEQGTAETGAEKDESPVEVIIKVV